jgi:hypothetical protein
VQLPRDEVGVSDIKGWQECPRRMSYQMKRWTEEGEPPESHANPHTRYGTAVHDGVQYMEETDAAPEEVVQFLMSNGHRWIDPEVSDELIADLEEHRNRDEPLEWRLVWNEQEIRVPLVVHKGVRIFYRARIDRLYQHREWPGRYRLRDTKTSRWMKTKEDVDHDEQMSAYDWAVREYLPEVEELEIVYDQLRFGEVPSRRSDDDRHRIKRWLQMGAIAVIDDDERGPDGLLVPEFNQFCAYCPILLGCPVVPMLTNYAQAEIARLAPEIKDGRTLRPQLDPDVFDVYVDQLPQVMDAKGVLERFEAEVKAALLRLPSSEREAYGFGVRTRGRDVFSPEALRAAHRLLGDGFYDVVSMSKEALTRATGSDEAKLKLIVGMADRRPGNPFVVRGRGTSTRAAKK